MLSPGEAYWVGVSVGWASQYVMSFLWDRHDKQQQKIAACKHKHGDLVPAVKDRWGRDTALIWVCKDCPFQVPLKMLRASKDLWVRQEDSERNRSVRSPRQ